MAAGPVTGGALIAAFGWRSVFWINAPGHRRRGVLERGVRAESRAPRARRLDRPGQVVLTVVGVQSSVGALIEGPHVGWTSPVRLGRVTWSQPRLQSGFAHGRAAPPEPLMDLTLFRRAAFTTAVLGAVACSPH